MHFDILTLFPEMFSGPLSASILGKARKSGLVSVDIWNIRDFALDKHRIVDDTPYGGGAGMVLKADVLARAIESVRVTLTHPSSTCHRRGRRSISSWRSNWPSCRA